MRKPAIATRVSPAINNAVKQLTKALGITVSEYLRKLILDDLESKRLFSQQFTKMTETPEAKEPEESPEVNIRKLLMKAFEEEEEDEGFW